MPEGDTVWRTAHRLHEALAGQPLVRAELRWPLLATADLVGMTTLEVHSRGKHVLHRLDSGLTLHTHLRMDGQWRVSAADCTPAAQTARHTVRAVLGSPEWTAVGSRLGMLDLVATSEEHELVGHLGPDLLGADWDLQLAIANLRRLPGMPIGAALLDQRNLAGIGTMWAAETLFMQRQPPWQPVGEVSRDRLGGILERARGLLDRGRVAGFQSSTGSTARGESSYVHARSGRPCRRCGTGVRVAAIRPTNVPGTADRLLFYCPHCQGGLAPTDSGELQRPLGSTRGRRR